MVGVGDGDIDDDDGYDLTRVSNVLLRSMCRLPVFGKWLGIAVRLLVWVDENERDIRFWHDGRG